MGNPRPLFRLFLSFQENITIFTTNMCAKMSIQYRNGAGIQTHDHQDMSLLPYPLDQGSRPSRQMFLAVCEYLGIEFLWINSVIIVMKDTTPKT